MIGITVCGEWMGRGRGWTRSVDIIVLLSITSTWLTGLGALYSLFYFLMVVTLQAKKLRLKEAE